MTRDNQWNQCEGWFKSSRSGGANNCVEVNLGDGSRVGIRDSKAGGSGDVLVVPAPAYRAFIADVRSGRFDR